MYVLMGGSNPSDSGVIQFQGHAKRATGCLDHRGPQHDAASSMAFRLRTAPLAIAEKGAHDNVPPRGKR